MSRSTVRITKRNVDAAERPATGEGRLWDSDLPGFCLRIYASGRKAYAVKYRTDGRQRWFTIGEHGAPWTPETARRVAQDVLYGAARGADAQALKVERRSDGTVADLIDEYLADGPLVKPEKRASSWNADRGCLNNHVRPLLGSKLVRDVTRADIGRMMKSIAKGDTRARAKTKPRGVADVKGGVGIANRALAVTKAMFSYADRAGHLKRNSESNPTKGMVVATSAARERFLSGDEATRLGRMIDAMVADRSLSEAHAIILRLLMLTGARKNEIVGLTWPEIDFAGRRLDLPPERTKAGGRLGRRRIQLNQAAIQLLKSVARTDGCEFVFPAAGGTTPTRSLQDAWEKVRARAELPGVRMHDLRHTFASFAVADGASLYLVAQALGHSQTRTTERYAHLTDDPLNALAERVAARMSPHRNGNPPVAD